MEGFPVVLEQKVVWRDLDPLGHVNNAVFGTYVENGRFEYFAQVLKPLLPREGPAPASTMGSLGLILAEQTITYRSPAYLGEVLRIGVRVTEIRNSSFIMEARIEEKETGRLVATSRAVMVHYDYNGNCAVPVPPAWREAMARAEGRTLESGGKPDAADPSSLL